MSEYNRISIRGRLGADPELKYTPSGVAVARFSLAYWRGKTQEGRDLGTAWFRGVAWREVAEKIASCEKGNRLQLEGRLDAREWTGNDGQKHTSIEIVVSEFKQLDSESKPSPAPAVNNGTVEGCPKCGEDIPFCTCNEAVDEHPAVAIHKLLNSKHYRTSLMQGGRGEFAKIVHTGGQFEISVSPAGTVTLTGSPRHCEVLTKALMEAGIKANP